MHGPGAPMWMVTYGDMMGLLLCFFVMLVAISRIDGRLFNQAAQSIRDALGLDGRSAGVFRGDPPSMAQRIQSLLLSGRTQFVGSASSSSFAGRFVVEQTREGLTITGGALEFEPGSAEPRAGAADVLGKLAREMRGQTTRIEIRGHAADDPLPGGGVGADRLDLSYARAKGVAGLLVKGGVEPERIRVVACGESEPVGTSASRENPPVENRRVEIVVTEVLTDRLKGGTSVR